MKKMRPFLIILGVIALIVIGFFVVRAIRNNTTTADQYTTEAITKGELIASVGATGVVRSGQSAQLLWQTSGTVKAVTTALGEAVNQGDSLATLDTQSLSQSMILVEADLIKARNDLEDLQDVQLAQAQARANLLAAESQVEQAQTAVNQITYTKASDSSIDSKRDAYQDAYYEVVKLEKSYADMADKADDDPEKAAEYSELLEAREAADKALQELKDLTGEAFYEKVEQAEAQLALAEAQLAEAQQAWDEIKDGANPDTIKMAEIRIQALEALLNAREITAPFDGTITLVNMQPGDQASMGSPAFRLDDLSKILVDVQISEMDISRIEIGQDVTLTFDGINDKTYHGTVIEVASVGTAVQGSVNFNIVVEITDADEEIRPPMTAGVSIVVNRLENVLLVPNRALYMQNGQRVVYVLRNGQMTAVPITIGASSSLFSEVLSGDIAEGDLVILNLPVDFFSSSPRGMFGN